MRTLHHLKPEKQVKIAQETLDIYSPLANRLGLSSLKRELEDLSRRLVVAVGLTIPVLLLAMLPMQGAQVPAFRQTLQRIDVVEQLKAPSICIVQRTGLPLTPAAEYFCDMVRRASLHTVSPPG